MTISTLIPRVVELAEVDDTAIIPLTYADQKITIQIPTGSTVLVEHTLFPAAAIDDDSAEWVAWTEGEQEGPFIKTLATPCTAIRFTAKTADAKFYLVS